MNALSARLAVALVAGTLALPAVAQQQATQDTYREAEDIVVHSSGGVRMGEVEEVLVDQQGNVAYAIEVEEGFLGLRDTEVILPADRLSYDAQNNRFSTDMTEAEIRSLPVWDD